VRGGDERERERATARIAAKPLGRLKETLRAGLTALVQEADVGR